MGKREMTAWQAELEDVIPAATELVSLLQDSHNEFHRTGYLWSKTLTMNS